MTYTIGVDPGEKGGIALIDHQGHAIEYAPMPDTVRGIVDLISEYAQECSKGHDVRMIVEKAQTMPRQGIVSAFNYGKHFGIFEPLAAVLSIKYIEVRPKEWKKSMRLNSEKVNSINACERLFPGVNLILPRCRKKHDGIAEALLIAEWGRK